VNELLVAPDINVETPTPSPVSDALERLAHGPRVIGELRGEADGPVLICVGSLHGNEPAGALALERLLRRLASPPPAGLRGCLVGLVGNRRALAAGRRFLHHDLNRFWNRERAARLRQRSEPLEAEADELRDLDRELERLLKEGEGRPVFFLDLHTTSGQGPAFANLDDTLPNRKFALELPVPLVVGIEEELAGTLASYLCDRGVMTVGFEAGQHQEPEAVDRAEAAVWIALEASGVLPRGSRPEVAAARRLLTENRGALPHVVEVLYRHVIHPGDRFRMLPGFRNFQPIAAGQLLAGDHRGPIVAHVDGCILMPLYQEQGEDGFFVARRIRPMWLKLSEYLRRLRLERYLHFLPGVRPNPALAESFTIDRRWARWYALQIFHLLGFRRFDEVGRYLVMARRTHDR